MTGTASTGELTPAGLLVKGWQADRAGAHADALAAFRRAEELVCGAASDGTLAYARAGIAHQLHRLGDALGAQEAFLALADQVAAGPPDTELLHQIAESLDELGDLRFALTWYDRLLAGSSAPPRELGTLLIDRLGTREGLGLPPDELDRHAEELLRQLETEAEHFAHDLAGLLENPAGPLRLRQRGLRVPDDGSAFDGLVLLWSEADFADVLARWPDNYGATYQDYRDSVERSARRYSDAGAARVRLVPTTLDAFLRFANSHRLDPAVAATRASYAQSLYTGAADRTVAWPPARNAACWCGSTSKYKKCCARLGEG